jgi:hypothetical protein
VPTIWRLKLDKADCVGRCEFCLDSGLAGMGWGVHLDTDRPAWADYRSKCVQEYGKIVSAARLLAEDCAVNDLVWTRTASDRYWLGRITGPWEYRNGGAYESFDIHNVRECCWIEVGDLCSVPGVVRNSFGRGTYKRINQAAEWYSIDIYNASARADGYRYFVPTAPMDLFSLVDPIDCEDIIAVWLQAADWVLHPSTCKKSTKRFEFTLVNRNTRRMAAVQVKQGAEYINVSDCEDFDGEVVLFQTHGLYAGSTREPSIHCLNAAELQCFCFDNLALMPNSVQRCFERLKNAHDFPRTNCI